MNATGSYFATREYAQQAIAMALPMIEAALRQPQRVGDSGFLHIVVMDPGLTPLDCAFDTAILHEHSIGDRAAWDADYAAYARAKTKLSWTMQQDSHVILQRYPQRLRAGDTSLWGSVALDGIVVGVSGAMPWFDECFATIVAACLRALVKGQAQQQKGVLAL